MYFKILNNAMNHNGYHYKEGLNIDINPFDESLKCKAGLFFSDEENILEYCNYGTKIAVVTVPQEYEIVDCDGKYKAHAIILSEVRDLYTVDTFKWLKSLGVNLHAGQDDVLRWASLAGYIEVVTYLVEQGLDIHSKKELTLRLSAMYGLIDIVKYAVEQGADIHVINEQALKLSIEHGHLDVVKYLVEHGADIHTDREKALKIAAINRNHDIMKYLISKGADASVLADDTINEIL